MMTMVTDVHEPQAWRLDELFDALDSPQVDVSLAQLESLVAQMEQYRPQLTPDVPSATFNEVVTLNEEIVRIFYRVYGFGSLSYSADTQDQKAQAYLARIGQLAAQAQNRTLFFSLWWKELDNANAERLIDEADPDLRYWLHKMRMQKPHTLSEAEEKVINLKDVNGVQAMTRLYDSITNRYSFKTEVNGEMREVTREELSVQYRSADPAQREAAYRELYRVYGYDAPILGQVYQAIMRDWRSENVDLRHYQSPMTVRNQANDIPDEVVDTLLSVVRRNAPLFHRFFKLKARWLGVEKLRRYDLYAPVVQSTKTYSYDEAVRLVLESFNQYDPQIARLARRVFDDQHYDGETRKGKRGGAFCATMGPQYTPWILHSFQGDPRDLATMAHELGHAIHSMLAEHHSILVQQSSLPMAETASTYCEMLLQESLLASDPDPELHRDLLFSSMDDAYATIMRQAYFAAFEREAHEAVHRNASVDEISAMYLDLLREQFGEAVEVSDDFRHEWVAIPHFFHTPFYVYAYAFGQLLALALYSRYRSEGASAIPGYLAILAAGGSEAPVTILRRAGIDIYSADFWQGGFDFLAEQLAELEKLPQPNA